jgi:hypothetical protein
MNRDNDKSEMPSGGDDLQVLPAGSQPGDLQTGEGNIGQSDDRRRAEVQTVSHGPMGQGSDNVGRFADDGNRGAIGSRTSSTQDERPTSTGDR